MTQKKEQRVNHSINAERGRELSQHAVNMARELKSFVGKKWILDALILLLQDKDVYEKTKKIIKNQK